MIRCFQLARAFAQCKAYDLVTYGADGTGTPGLSEGRAQMATMLPLLEKGRRGPRVRRIPPRIGRR